jgi:hypothetical protein
MVTASAANELQNVKSELVELRLEHAHHQVKLWRMLSLILAVALLFAAYIAMTGSVSARNEAHAQFAKGMHRGSDAIIAGEEPAIAGDEAPAALPGLAEPPAPVGAADGKKKKKASKYAPVPTAPPTAIPTVDEEPSWIRDPNFPPAGKCTQPNRPSINVTFWRSLPRYGEFMTALEKFNRLLLDVDNRAAGEPGKALIEHFLWIMRELVRPNPYPLPFLPPHNTTMGLVGHAMVIVDCYYADGERFLQSHSLGAQSHRCRNFDAFSNQRSTHYYFEESFIGNLRAHKDPAYKPKYFIDFGARDYGDRQVNTEGADKAYTYYDSSVRFFEATYPNFDKMHVFAMEVDPQYAEGFKALERKRNDAKVPGVFRFLNSAAWVHGDGLALQQSFMMSTEVFKCDPTEVASGSGRCRCISSADSGAMLRSLPKRGVSMKLDIEGAEWVVLEQWFSTGALEHIGEMFFECHSTRTVSQAHNFIFPGPPSGLRNNFLNDVFTRTVGDIDCFFVHDYLRANGIVTHGWP